MRGHGFHHLGDRRDRQTLIIIRPGRQNVSKILEMTGKKRKELERNELKNYNLPKKTTGTPTRA